MSFPSPSVTVPTFVQYPSLWYGGVEFGPAPFYLRGDQGNALSGLGMPPVRSGDTSAPRAHGSYIGLDLLDVRQPTITIDVGPPFGLYGSLEGAMSALRTALTPTGTTENPLFLQVSAGSPMLVAMVRPRKRDLVVDLPYVFGGLSQTVPIQWNATDPAWYAAGTLDPTVGAPAPLGGFGFNLSFDLSFGGGVAVSLISAVNSGDLPCYPLITFVGPCTFPTLANSSIVGSPFIQFGLQMLTGDMLVVNTDPKYRSVNYVTAGSTVGSSRLYTLTQGSNWWALPPDSTSVVEFTTLDTVPVSGTVTMAYTSAFSAAA